VPPGGAERATFTLRVEDQRHDDAPVRRRGR
jgi:hypothetical protein